MADRPRAAIYARFSNEMSNAMSAEDQARLCRERAEREGWDVVSVYTDLAMSGTRLDLPGRASMLAAAATRQFEIIIVEDLDRFSRNLADTATFFQRLTFDGVRIYSLSSGWITELDVGIRGTLNALELKKLAEKIRRGQSGEVTRGYIPGGRAYGYEAAPELLPGGKVRRGIRRIVDQEADVIRRIYREFLSGRSPRDIAHRLNADGIPSPHGSEWRASTICGSRARRSGILHNPIYSGRFVYGRVHMVQDPATRRRLSRTNPDEQMIEHEHPELRIVPEDQWLAVQRWRESNTDLPARAQRRPRHALSGLVKCARCGGNFSVITKSRWGCTRHREAGTCDNPRRISTDRLEDRVFGALKRALLAPERIAEVIEEARLFAERGREADTRQRQRLENRISRGKRAITNFVTAIGEGTVDFPEVRSAMRAAKADIAAAEAELAEMAAAPIVILHPQIVAAYRQRIEKLGDALVSGEKAREHLATIRGLVDVVTIDDDADEPDSAKVEILGNLTTAIAIATGNALPAKIDRTVLLVAEEGLEPPTRGL